MEEYKQQVSNYLRDETQLVSRIFANLERQTNLPRESLAAGVGGLFSLYLVFGYFAELVCNFIGFAYPAYASMVAIESSDKNDDTQWLTYWCVYAVFSLIDFAADIICGWFPFYWLAKCIFLIYLYHPLTMGARNIYINYARPLLQKCTGIVNKAGEAVQQGQQAVVAAAADAATAPPPPPPAENPPPPPPAENPPPPQ